MKDPPPNTNGIVEHRLTRCVVRCMHVASPFWHRSGRMAQSVRPETVSAHPPPQGKAQTLPRSVEFCSRALAISQESKGKWKRRCPSPTRFARECRDTMTSGKTCSRKETSMRRRTKGLSTSGHQRDHVWYIYSIDSAVSPRWMLYRTYCIVPYMLCCCCRRHRRRRRRSLHHRRT